MVQSKEVKGPTYVVVLNGAEVTVMFLSLDQEQNFDYENESLQKKRVLKN